jgi:hypothetical protein
MRQVASDGYYEEVREVSIIPLRQPISARNAHRCWTGAMRTSENPNSRIARTPYLSPPRYGGSLAARGIPRPYRT